MMETKALKETIELTLRFKDYVKRNIYHRENLPKDFSEGFEFAEKMHLQAFKVASEFIINSAVDEKTTVAYYQQVKLMLAAMKHALSIPYKGDNEIKSEADQKRWDLFLNYVGSMNRFTMAFKVAVEPYYTGPAKLEDLNEIINSEKELRALMGKLTPEHAEEINAKLVFVRHANILKALKTTYQERTPAPKKIHWATAVAHLIKEPESVEYIYRLLANLEACYYNAPRNNPYSLTSVESAMKLFEVSKLPPDQELAPIHKALAKKKAAGPKTKKSAKS